MNRRNERAGRHDSRPPPRKGWQYGNSCADGSSRRALMSFILRGPLWQSFAKLHDIALWIVAVAGPEIATLPLVLCRTQSAPELNGLGARRRNACNGKAELDRHPLADFRRIGDADRFRNRSRYRVDDQLHRVRIQHGVVRIRMHGRHGKQLRVEPGNALDILGEDDGAGSWLAGHDVGFGG